MMNWAAAALIFVTAAMLFRNVFARDKKRCGAAILITCGKDSEGLTEQVCAYHNDERAGGGLYRRRIVLVSPDGEFCREARELTERFDDVISVSAEELTEMIRQGRL